MKISVCMATYNGEKYIEKQVWSILSQMGDIDELIIIDDGSVDNTVQLIKNFNDRRIRLNINQFNQGVTKTFEAALELAEGELIFFSDQDDIWFQNKIHRIKMLFKQYPVDIIQHDAQVVGSNMEIIKKSFKELRNAGNGVIKNIISNTYLGCSMVLRKSVVDKCLPIPKQKGYHDRWLGVIAEMQGFKILFVDDILLSYIRHEGTGSNLERRNLWIIMIDRLDFIKNIIVFLTKKKFRKLQLYFTTY